MNLNRYIKHPEELNRETLYELRSLVALYPYHQTARLLMLQNMYLLRDPMFDEELRQAAFYITDRATLFNMIEAPHYTIRKEVRKVEAPTADRTDTLINNFLEAVPQIEEERPHRRPTAADAAIDYVAYLLETEGLSQAPQSSSAPQQDLIDKFLNEEGGKLTLQDDTDYTPHTEVQLENDKDELAEDYHTETLAKIYIKQGKYLQALAIIRQLNLNNSKKNAYFADQMRFLEKIIAVKSHNSAKNQ